MSINCEQQKKECQEFFSKCLGLFEQRTLEITSNLNNTIASVGTMFDTMRSALNSMDERFRGQDQAIAEVTRLATEKQTRAAVVWSISGAVIGALLTAFVVGLLQKLL